MSDFPVMEYQDPEAPDGETALGLLQAIYRDKRTPLHTRMRAATIAIALRESRSSVSRHTCEMTRALLRRSTAPSQVTARGRVTLELSATASRDNGAGEGEAG